MNTYPQVQGSQLKEVQQERQLLHSSRAFVEAQLYNIKKRKEIFM